MGLMARSLYCLNCRPNRGRARRGDGGYLLRRCRDRSRNPTPPRTETLLVRNTIVPSNLPRILCTVDSRRGHYLFSQFWQPHISNEPIAPLDTKIPTSCHRSSVIGSSPPFALSRPFYFTPRAQRSSQVYSEALWVGRSPEGTLHLGRSPKKPSRHSLREYNLGVKLVP
jgi:hypothetical protein